METGYYYIDGDYGWNQEKFTDPIMKGGGCAAVTACDICIFLSRFFGEKNPVSYLPLKNWLSYMRICCRGKLVSMPSMTVSPSALRIFLTASSLVCPLVMILATMES